MNDFESFFDRVDGAKDGRSNEQLEMKELRTVLNSASFTGEERKLATMLLEEYDLAKSLRDGGGQISRDEFRQYIDLNRGRLSDKDTVFSPALSSMENRRSYLSNLMERINYNFSSDKDDNRYLTRDELQTAMSSGRDKYGSALKPAERELIETLYLNWKRDIKNVSERKGEDNDGISVYDLYALAERQPAKFADISRKIDQTYKSVLPELMFNSDAAVPPGPEPTIPPPVEIPLPQPIPPVEVPVPLYRVPPVDTTLIIRDALRIPGQVLDSVLHHRFRHHHHNHYGHYRDYQYRDYHHHRDYYHHHHDYNHHHHDYNRDNYYHRYHHNHKDLPHHSKTWHGQPHSGDHRDPYNFHGGAKKMNPVIDRYGFHGGRK